MADNWYDHAYDEYMADMEESFNEEIGIEYAEKASDLLNRVMEEDAQFSIARLAILYALFQSAHSTIKAASSGELELLIQETVPSDPSWWNAGVRPKVFMTTLRRMAINDEGEGPGFIELVLSEGKRKTIIGAKITSYGMAYGNFHGLFETSDLIRFLSHNGEWPPKEDAQYDLRLRGLFDGFTTEVRLVDLKAALIGFSSKDLFDRRQTVSFNRAYEAIVNHDALVCYQFLPDNIRRNVIMRLLPKDAPKAMLLDSIDTIENMTGWHERFKKLKSQSNPPETPEGVHSNFVEDYVIRIAWLLIKEATDQQVLPQPLRPRSNPQRDGEFDASDVIKQQVFSRREGSNISYQGFSRAGET